MQTHAGRRGAGLVQHLRQHVDTDDITFGTDLAGGDKAVETRSGTGIDDFFAGLQGAQAERIADPGERFHRSIG